MDTEKQKIESELESGEIQASEQVLSSPISNTQPEPRILPPKPQSKFIPAIIFISLLGMIIIFGVLIFDQKPIEPVKAEEHAPVVVNPFDSVQIEGASGVVIDLRTKEILYAKNASSTLPLASVTKLMSAYTALSYAPDILSISISPEDIQLLGDQGLIVGETWRLDDLLDFSLVTSSNDGMRAIARAVGEVENSSFIEEENRAHFIGLMNKTANELGLTSMSFKNETGLDEITGGTGGVGSAYDVAQLLGLIAQKYPDALTRTRSDEFSVTSLSGLIHVGRNTNLSAAAIPGLMGSKTGFTDLAGGNLAIVFNRSLNYPIAVVVLGSSVEGRFRDVNTLVNATYDYFQLKH